jgi:hypothetical protein
MKNFFLAILMTLILTGCESFHEFEEGQNEAVMQNNGLASPNPDGSKHCFMFQCLLPWSS